MTVNKTRWRKWYEEKRSSIVDNIVGNMAYDVLKWIVGLILLGLLGLLVSPAQSWAANAISVLGAALSTKIVVTVGTLIAVGIPTLVLGIIWLRSARKRSLHRRESKQRAASLNRRIAELERDKQELLEIQKSDHDRLNAQTRESNELRREQRAQKVFRAIYYDSDYRTSWIEHPEAVADFFAKRGFEVVDAHQLRNWIDERMSFNESPRSLLAFAQDIMPHTVADLRSDTCKLRLFLDRGGRVVWHGDVPFWNQGYPGGRHEVWRADGPSLVLEVGTILYNRSLRGVLTDLGAHVGYRPSWSYSPPSSCTRCR